jgi:hypothetical protein
VRPLGVESDVTNFSLLKQLNRIGRELRIGGHNSKVFFNTLSNQQTIEWGLWSNSLASSSRAERAVCESFSGLSAHQMKI